MKGTAVAAVAALAGGVSARKLHQRHAHHALSTGDSTCGCTTVVETIYGEPTLLGVTPIAPAETVTHEAVVVPTPAVETCPTPGVYTFPATTVTLTETTTVCGASSTHVPAGKHTIGGVTTVVEEATTVVCPYATTHADNGVVTSVIETTTYVCPSAGTYTIAPVTTEVVEETVVVIPVVETYSPGTYTRPEVVTTVTETSFVVVCPYTTSPVPVAEPTSPAEHSSPAEHTSPAGPHTTESPETDVAEPEPETSEAETGKPQPTSSPSVGGSGDHWAMTYTPYNDNHLCKTKSQIDGDIAAIAASGFKAIRVYSTDCNTLEWVGGACAANGIKIIVGIFFDSPGCGNSGVSPEDQIDAIASWAKWDLVEAVVVGNEAIFGGHCSASDIAGYIGMCKSKFSGYSGPYTTAETLNIWEKPSTQSGLCGAVDIIGANIHPYFNAGVKASEAGSFVAGQLSIIDTVCPGKSGVNLECGWPSAGLPNGDAVPGAEEQKAAIASIRSKVGSRTCFFSYHNDGWKAPGACECERSWGCGDLF